MIYFLEDDDSIRKLVIYGLESQGFEAEGFSLEVLSVAAPRRARRVFLYHTHTYEAYEMEAGDTYRETEKWRTSDAEHNIVRVGAELEKYLMAAGVSVTHDTTAFPPPIPDRWWGCRRRPRKAMIYISICTGIPIPRATGPTP